MSKAEALQFCKTAVERFMRLPSTINAQLALEELGLAGIVLGVELDVEDAVVDEMFRLAAAGGMGRSEWPEPQREEDREAFAEFAGKEQAAVEYVHRSILRRPNGTLAKYYNEVLRMRETLENVRTQLLELEYN